MGRNRGRSDVPAGPGADTSKADHAYSVILQRILRGDCPPGDRLVIERLARDINVSVVPVREAIRRLEAEGYVTYTRNVGATVTTIDMDRYPETVETVAVLVGVAIGLAVPHITAADIRKARSINDRLRDSLDTLEPRQFTRANHQFHQILFQRCPNRHILGILEREWALLETTRRSAFSFIPERAAESVEEHEQLLRLIEEGRPGPEIETFARDHRMRTVRRLLQHLGDHMPDVPSISEAPR
jgi:DNA-binding GntR family transcriptional regulator